MTSARTKSSDSVNTSPAADTSVDSDAKCDNHPQRKATTYTQDGAIEQHLCDECAPAWYR